MRIFLLILSVAGCVWACRKPDALPSGRTIAGLLLDSGEVFLLQEQRVAQDTVMVIRNTAGVLGCWRSVRTGVSKASVSGLHFSKVEPDTFFPVGSAVIDSVVLRLELASLQAGSDTALSVGVFVVVSAPEDSPQVYEPRPAAEGALYIGGLGAMAMRLPAAMGEALVFGGRAVPLRLEPVMEECTGWGIIFPQASLSVYYRLRGDTTSRRVSARWNGTPSLWLEYSHLPSSVVSDSLVLVKGWGVATALVSIPLEGLRTHSAHLLKAQLHLPYQLDTPGAEKLYWLVKKNSTFLLPTEALATSSLEAAMRPSASTWTVEITYSLLEALSSSQDTLHLRLYFPTLSFLSSTLLYRSRGYVVLYLVGDSS